MNLLHFKKYVTSKAVEIFLILPVKNRINVNTIAFTFCFFNLCLLSNK